MLLQAYIFVGDPVFHHIAYGVIVVAITLQAFYNLKLVIVNLLQVLVFKYHVVGKLANLLLQAFGKEKFGECRYIHTFTQNYPEGNNYNLDRFSLANHKFTKLP